MAAVLKALKTVGSNECLISQFLFKLLLKSLWGKWRLVHYFAYNFDALSGANLSKMVREGVIWLILLSLLFFGFSSAVPALSSFC